MLPAGASEGDRQIAFAFADVMRHEIDQQFRDAIDEFFRLRELADIGCDFRMLPRQRTEFGNKVRIRQKANIKYQVGIAGHAVLETEAYTGNENVVAAAFPILKLFQDMRSQFMDIELGGIDDHVSQIADEIELFALRTDGGCNGRTFAERMRSPRLAEAPHEGLI